MSTSILPQNVSHTVARAILVTAALVALAIIVIPVYVGNDARPLGDEWFVGADTYMRIVRVQEWWQGGQWYESVSARSNWPVGETLHWTRPLDIMLMVLAAPFWPFLGFHKALFISGVIVSPVAAVLSMWALVRGVRGLLDLRGQVILLVLFAVQPITRFYFLAARPDHHSLILLAFTVTLALLLHHAHSPNTRPHAPAWAGAVTAFGIWVSVESLTTELFALTALGLPWLITGNVQWLAALRRFTFAGALALAAMLVIEHPPGAWLTSEEYDRLSSVHVVLLALIALGVEAMWRTRERVGSHLMGRLITGLGASAAAATVMAALFPDFFKGPFGAAMDPRLADLWLGKIQELQPLWGTDWDTVMGAVHILGPTVWLVVWAWIRRQERQAGQGNAEKPKANFDETTLILILVGLLYVPLSLFQVRWGAYLGVGVAVAWAVVLQRLLDWRGGPTLTGTGTPILRVPAFVGVALLHVFIGALLAMIRPDVQPDKTTACKWRDLQPVLVSEAFGGGRPQVILSHIHQGSEILYRTPHRVIGTPYHRNTNGILDNYTALATTDDTEMRAILARRGVDFIVLCADSPEERHFLKIKGETMTRRIATQNAPVWLQKMPLPAELEEHFRIFRFQPDKT